MIVFELVVTADEILMSRSAFGHHCAATGSNEHVADYWDVKVGRVRLTTYAMLGLLVKITTICGILRRSPPCSRAASPGPGARF